jgi:hypothetical protein
LPADSDAMRASPSTWAAIGFVAYLAVQLLLPLHQLFVAEGPFGWRMYASRSSAGPPRVAILARDGSSQALSSDALRRYVLRGKSLELSLDRLAPHLCRQRPDAAAIHLRWPRSQITIPGLPRSND